MSAELLGRAAALMRERADAAADATLRRPWGSDGEQVTGGDGQWMLVATTPDAPEGSPGSLVAPYIASWHPAVALAVADWLDLTAESIDPNMASYDEEHEHRALAVARAYLGESA